ncbi:xanthine dehydrogenase/oxidase-like isoform X2 [Babylonia areolata]|uniref:xanthine dehydrogenase/oxidase-like isoform X2 n=1 Tax=Babylonia areolata TaxID=304850 RepID=UPI003FD18748
MCRVAEVVCEARPARCKMAGHNDLVFSVNGKQVTVSNPDPETTLLQFLRLNLQLTGTKLGCGEGGCGACTVMVSFWSADSDTARHYSANACLLPLCSLHGMAVTTVEGIGSHRTRLHPLQEQIAAHHGTQCGFCTPGFVMSMYTLLRNSPTPTVQQLESAFEGNLCRCTGYRPILDAYRPFTQGGVCALGDQCCKNIPKIKNTNQNGDTLASSVPNELPISSGIQNENASLGNIQDGNSTSSGVAEQDGEMKDHADTGREKTGAGIDVTQEPIFPPFLKLQGEDLNSQSLVFTGPRVTWYRPVSLAEFLDIKRAHPHCKIVAGNTEIGVEMKVKKQMYPELVSATRVPELTTVQRVSSGIRLGASVTLATLECSLKEAVGNLPEEKTRVFSAFVEMLRWFAGPQIRNVATLGGNIMTASPISDLNPLLLACGAHLEFVSTDGSRREVKMDGSFFKGYRTVDVHPDEILLSVLLPFSHKNEFLHAYKQANRKDEDYAIVKAAMRVVLDERCTVQGLTLAFGGMATTTVTATRTTTHLLGRTWDKELLDKACDLLTSDLPLDPGSPGGDVEYRRSLAVSFFFKFYMTVLKQLQEQGVVEGIPPIPPKDRTVADPPERGPSHGLQWYSLAPEVESPHSALRRPVVHESAYKQATGEAVYVDDMAPLKGELHLALVHSSQARAKLVRVDPTAALSMPGVVDYISHKDVPGKGTWTITGNDAEEIFASEEVVNQGQVIGAILADTLTNAQRAAQAVEISYDVMDPVITIADAIEKESFYPWGQTLTCGDVEEAFSREGGDVRVVVEGEVHVEAQEHFYLETHGTIAFPTEDLAVEVVSSTQNPTFMQTVIAESLGVSKNKVKCRARRIGGGFGGKESRFALHVLPTVIAANKHQRPVRCVLERQEDMMMTGTRHPFLGKYKMGLDGRGKIVAFDVQYYMNAGSSLDLSHSVAEKAVLEAESCYHIPNLRARAYLCRTNIPSCTAFRGYGAPQAVIVMETALLQAARQMGVAPEELRDVNLYADGDVIPSGPPLTQCTLRRCWDDVMAQGKFTERRKEVDRFNSENRWRKRGVAVTPAKFGMSYTLEFLNQGAALVNIYTDGTVLISHGGVEMGQGLHTKVMQVASQVLNIPLSKICMDETSTGVVPNTPATAASLSSDLFGAAVLDACSTLMKRLKPIQDGNPQYSWEQLVVAAYLDRVSLSATGFYKATDVGYNIETGQGQAFNYLTYGAACSVVEVDCLTGDHHVLSTDIVMDVGKSLNPAIDIGQIEGAFMQGYGLVALEQYKVQGDGTLLTRGPGSYKIPSVGNIPRSFNVSLLTESGNPKALYSSKGVGEPPLLLAVSVLGAIHDAVRAARTDEGLNPFVPLNTPATPARVRMACCDRFTRLYEGEEKKSNRRPWFVDL